MESTGNFYHQHDVDIINEHAISIFNNNSKDFFDGDKVDGHNEIIIYDFVKNQHSSYLKDSLAKEHAETIYQGRVKFAKWRSFLRKQTMEEYYFLMQMDYSSGHM